MSCLRKVSLLLALGLVLSGASAAILHVARSAAQEERQAGLARARADLTTLLSAQGLTLGAPVFMRIFKEESLLEVWMQRVADGAWVLARRYPMMSRNPVSRSRTTKPT